MCRGLNGVIMAGGHVCPSSILGDELLWKKAQKKAVKNRTSEVMNKIIPTFSPLTTSS